MFNSFMVFRVRNLRREKRDMSDKTVGVEKVLKFLVN